MTRMKMMRTDRYRRGVLLLLVAMVALLPRGGGWGGDPAGGRPPEKPVVRAWTPGPLPENEVNLLLMADWGSNDTAQREVARAMAKYVAGGGGAVEGGL